MNVYPGRQAFDQEGDLPVPIGVPALSKLAFDGFELAPTWNMLVHRVADAPDDAAALLDLSAIALLQGRPDDRITLQLEALKLQRVYRQLARRTTAEPLRLLAFMAPGDFKANLPVEFLLTDSSVQLDMLYVMPGEPLPDVIPDHDVALVAIAESDEAQPLLRDLAVALHGWSKPVINAPDRVARLSRDGTWGLLKSAPGVEFPINVRIGRARLTDVATGEAAIETVLEGSGFPIIARPLDSHAGEGLEQLADHAAITRYLQERPEENFYIAPYIDYRGPDGLFRKYRVALIDGRPYACHMAISDHWMIYYLNAGMRDDPAKRAEEARFMADFDNAFAVRHANAMSAVAKLAGLEYLPIDCGETRDGRLLIFESGTNMIVHSMDPPNIFPHKQVQMEKVFTAFQTMLRNRSSGDVRTAANGTHKTGISICLHQPDTSFALMSQRQAQETGMEQQHFADNQVIDKGAREGDRITELVIQRHEYDCGVCTSAMYLGKSYEETVDLFSKAFEGDWDPNTPITHNFQLLVLLTAGEPSALVARLNPARPAIVATISLRHKDSGHMVYWDGQAVFDPTLGQKIDSFAMMMSTALGFTQRISDLSV